MGRRRNQPLYHWSPIERRPLILQHGLQPSSPPTTGSGAFIAPYLCFADSPSWAWALSAGCVGEPGSHWDLWQTWLYDLDNPKAIRCNERPSGMHEVRTRVAVPPTNLWHAGTREVPDDDE